MKNEAFQQMNQVKLENKQTMFWRYQTGQPDGHLATIEVNEQLKTQLRVTGLFLNYLVYYPLYLKHNFLLSKDHNKGKTQLFRSFTKFRHMFRLKI